MINRVQVRILFVKSAKQNFMSKIWSYVLCVFSLLVMVSESQGEDANECMKRQKNLALLDLTEETLSKAKEEVSDCSGQNGTESNATDCSKKGKTLAFIDIASNLVADVKKNYTSCPAAKQSSPLHLKPMDCLEVLENGHSESGVYTIWPSSRFFCNKFLDVYCDMESDGGGWTVIQRRRRSSSNETDFFRGWEDYKNGFGAVTDDFWIGNDNIHVLSNQGCYAVRFDLKDVFENKTVAVYDTFWIDDEGMSYTLHIANYSGNAGDAMEFHNNQMFTTKDRENDHYYPANCANLREGGWWYNDCTDSNLNGVLMPGEKGDKKGVFWRKWKDYESLAETEIKLRRK